MPFATNGDVRLFWRQDGADDRPALLLLGSILTDHMLWDRMLPFLADHFRIVRMDTRGHGASDGPSRNYAISDLAADAWCVLDAAGVEEAMVCGLSIGGMTALEMALQNPARLTGIIVACSSASMDRDLWNDRIAHARQGHLPRLIEEALDRWFDPAGQQTLARWIDPLRWSMQAVGVEGYCGCAAAIRDMKIADSLQRIAVPTLVIGATDDHGTPHEEHGQRIASQVAGAKEVRIAAGHLACLDSPGAFASAVGLFLGQLREERQDPARNGERVRREVLGNEWVNRSLEGRDPWIADYQDYATEVAWHRIWGRLGLDYRTRRLLVLATTASLGRWEEFRLHVRLGLERGSLTIQDVKEASLQAGLYAGVPVANTAFAECRSVFRALGISDQSC